MHRHLLLMSSALCLGAEARSPGGSPWPGPVPAGAEVQLGPSLGADADLEFFVWSADGRWLYTSNGGDGIVRWDAATGWPDTTLATGQDLFVGELAADPRGRFVVARSGDHLVRITLPSGTTGEPIAVSAGGGFLTQIAVSPSGTQVAVGRCATTAAPVEVFDLDRGTSAWAGRGLRGDDGESCAKAVAWLPDGRLIGGGDDGGWVILSQQGVVLKEGSIGGVSAEALALSPTGSELAIGGYGGAINVVSTRSGTPTWSAGFMNDPVRSVEFSADGRWLAAQWGRSVGVWDAQSHHPVVRSPGLGTAHFSPQGDRIAWGHPGTGTPVLTSIGDWDQPAVPLDAHRAAHDLTFSDDGRSLLIADRAGGVAVWDVTTGRLERWLQPPGRSRSSAATWHRGAPITGADRLGAATASRLVNLEASPDGRLAGLLSDPPALWVDGQVTPLPEAGDTLAWTADGAVVVEGWLQATRWQEGVVTRVCDDLHRPTAVAVGADGLWLASGSTIYRVTNRGCTPMITVPGGVDVRGLAASPDGRWLVAAADRTHLVQVRTGEISRTIDLHMLAVAWSPDGARWAGAVHDGAVLVWRAP